MMKYLIVVLILTGCIFSTRGYAQISQRDTLQTFTYGSPSQAKYVFPPLGKRYEKILMHYKLRCPFDGPCGEWDYLMYVWLFDHTKKMDSVIDTVYSFIVNGLSQPMVSFNWNPTWSYFPSYNLSVRRLSTTSLDTATIGTGVDTTHNALQTTSDISRSQFIWKKAELLAAGLKKGDITGMRLKSQSSNATMDGLLIRMKLSTKDSLMPSSYESGGLLTVYKKDTKFAFAGWNTLDFPSSFTWDGSSNIVVDVSFDNRGGASNGATLFSDATAYSSGIYSTKSNTSEHFENNDMIDVPVGALAGCDSAITIAFWQYGNPKYQPQNQSSFEAINSVGQRVLNAHVPWSDGTVYWDAGELYGGFDRIQKAADSNDYKGKWTYWAFVKNVKTGVMTIYQNGVQFQSGSAKKKPMADIVRFHLGSGSNGDNNFDGNIDEFSIWNIDLPAATITKLMSGGVSSELTYKKNLRLYYNFSGNSKFIANDVSGNGFDGTLTGLPIGQRVEGKNVFLGFSSTSKRPVVTFEQGVYTSKVDTTSLTDSAQNDAMQIVRYAASTNGPIVRDTLYVWPPPNTAVHDTTMTLVKTPYFRKFEIVNRFEIARYITPYGNGLSLGNGFTWTYDVSDYRPLLHDTVDLSAYNQQELVDVTFEFIKGSPPRDPISVRNLWNGNMGFGGAISIEEALKPMRIKIPNDAMNTRVKMRPTGHGFGDQDNCAEFCPKDHWLMVDGTERFRRTVFRDDCGLNPVYPQGGTWVYSRTNWCPGSYVETYDIETSPFTKPGDSVTLDYNIEDYRTNGSGGNPYYDIETQLVTYGKPNFSVSAAIEEIKSPSTTDLFRRQNPICGNPKITIKNNGSKTLKSLDIEYGVIGAPRSTNHWVGNLEFQEKADVDLGKFSWASDSKRFRVNLLNPNGGADDYPNDNMLESDFTPPLIYPSQLVFEYKTNSSPTEDSYTLSDINGNVLISRDNTLSPNTTYRDTVTLPDGCYTFQFLDEGHDGLSWWANTAQGSGSMKIKKLSGGTVLKTFGTDFGIELYQQFGVGSFADVPSTRSETTKLEVFPNPAQKIFTVEVAEAYAQDVVITVLDMLGVEVYRAYRHAISSERILVDLTGFPSGTYIIRSASESGVMSKKVVIQ